MPRDKFQHRCQHVGVFQPGAQGIRRKASQPKQARSPPVIFKNPPKHGQCDDKRIVNRIFGMVNYLSPPFEHLMVCMTALFRWGAEQDGGKKMKRILVVEDNDLNRKLFCDVLSANGFTVDPVADGQNALQRARDFVPNLVIMDIQLPNISGLDLIAQLKNDPMLRDTPVLAVTAYAGKGDEERIRDVGAKGYLAKPVSIGPFMSAVKSLLAPGPQNVAA